MCRFRLLAALLAVSVALPSVAERQVIDGVTYECSDGLCRIVGADEPGSPAATNAGPAAATRVFQGYAPAEEFVRFLKDDVAPQEARLPTDVWTTGCWLGLLAVLLGGLALNLTPCVLPMIPVNLLIIGRSAVRGAWYGLGIALAYGALGVAAAVGGLAFGTIQGSPWFNLVLSILFLFLAFALSGRIVIDLSRGRRGFAERKQTFLPWLFAFLMGAASAVLAGACVAPILISVLFVTGKMFAEGQTGALALPFVLGLGMALPWPFLGAGLRVLPRPGSWMKWVNRGFALLVCCFSLWYARLAWLGFTRPSAVARASDGREAVPETFRSAFDAARRRSAKPILVDCWASWCKNCAAMDRVLAKPEVRQALEGFELIRLQAEDIRSLNALSGFESVRGLPAFVVFE